MQLEKIFEFRSLKSIWNKKKCSGCVCKPKEQ